MTVLRGDVSKLLDAAAAVLLDFDGPVCEVFAKRPAEGVAGSLRQEIAMRGVVDTDAIAGESDPLAVLRWSGTLNDRSMCRALEEVLVREELLAVEAAEPSEGLVDFLTSMRQRRAVVIVTNNSEAAARAFMRLKGLEGMIRGVSGRLPGHPERMKPSPEPLLRAAKLVGQSPDQLIMIGDSVTDLQAASLLNMATILLANKPRKETSFVESEAAAVITSMSDLAEHSPNSSRTLPAG